MGDVVAMFMEPISEVFPYPKSVESNEAGFLKTYVGTLENFDDDVLTLAAQKILETRESKSFPVPAHCIAACKEAMQVIAARRAHGVGADQGRRLSASFDARYLEWSEGRRAQADELICCEMGKTAAQEGWIWTLWDWCREMGRLPSAHEALKIRKKGMDRKKTLDAATLKIPALRKFREKTMTRLTDIASGYSA